MNNRWIRSLLLLVVGALSLHGCAQGSCSYVISDTAGASYGTCLEQISTSSKLSTQNLQDFCRVNSGTYSSSACDSNTDIARCSLPTREVRDSEGNTITYYFKHHFYAPLTLDQARAACTSVGGTFSEATR